MENIHPRKNPWYYIGRVRGYICFYPCGYYVGSGQVVYAKTFGERRDRWHGFVILTGVATKTWGPQQKTLYWC